ncbi:hypothetical protein AVEN_180543-1 [Araneus ventricosus]|uniref:Uncharacterized protein n=1 Tax=Araneus ventricosus TaxID=182803 RepID=A0A4Y2FL51_ARAVE|nr:hypothetical protein AVEN_180543-1 [Araneus ventricosus]
MKNSFDVLSCRMFGHCWISVVSQHVINGTHNIEHFLFGDVSVAVDVVQAKDPLQLVNDTTSRQDGEDVEELLLIEMNALTYFKFYKNDNVLRHFDILFSE